MYRFVLSFISYRPWDDHLTLCTIIYSYSKLGFKIYINDFTELVVRMMYQKELFKVTTATLPDLVDQKQS